MQQLESREPPSSRSPEELRTVELEPATGPVPEQTVAEAVEAPFQAAVLE